MGNPRTSNCTFSSIDEGEDGAGEWHGIDIGGFSSVFNGNNGGDIIACSQIEENANHEGGHDGRDVPFNWCNEGGPASDTGGNHLSDNSGVLAYVRILEAGRSGVDDILIHRRRPALILGAVGYETQISNVQIKGAAGNGIQLWGGTVNLSKVVIADTYNSDIDVQRGYVRAMFST